MERGDSGSARTSCRMSSPASLLRNNTGLIALAATELAGRRSRPFLRRRALATGVDEAEGGHTHAAKESSGFASA